MTCFSRRPRRWVRQPGDRGERRPGDQPRPHHLQGAVQSQLHPPRPRQTSGRRQVQRREGNQKYLQQKIFVAVKIFVWFLTQNIILHKNIFHST